MKRTKFEHLKKLQEIELKRISNESRCTDQTNLINQASAFNSQSTANNAQVII